MPCSAAIRKQHPDVLRTLVELSNVNINAPVIDFEAPQVIFASSLFNARIDGASADILEIPRPLPQDTTITCSLLDMAAKREPEEMVEILVAAGADVAVTDSEGRTPVWCAAHLGHETSLQVLLAAGADADTPSHAGATPLWVAAVGGHEGALRILVAAGADVDTPNPNSKMDTPIWAAASKSNVACVRFLVAAGADVNATNYYGVNPLGAAANHGCGQTIRTLLRANAEVNEQLFHIGASDEVLDYLREVDEHGYARVADLARKRMRGIVRATIVLLRLWRSHYAPGGPGARRCAVSFERATKRMRTS